MMSLLQTAALTAALASCAAAADRKDNVSAARQATRPAVTVVRRPATRPVATAPALAGATTAPAADDPVVTVNGDVITQADFEETLQAGLQGRTVPPAQLAMLRQRWRPMILNVLIDNALLEEAAEKAKVTIDDAEVKERLEKELAIQAQSQGMTEEELAERIKKGTGKDYREYIAEQAALPFRRHMLLNSKLIEKEFPDEIKVSDAEVQEYYDKNPPPVRASHILVKTQGMSDEEKAEAKKKAEEILVEAKKPDADFAELARKYSDCPSKTKGGDLNFFPRRGAMVEPFAKAAFDMKIGDISDVVETQFGYHIIKLTDRKERSPVARDQLERQKIGAQIKKYAAELREDAKIVYAEGQEPRSRPARPILRRPSTRPATTRN